MAACITLLTAIIGVFAVDAVKDVFNSNVDGDINVAKDNAIVIDVTNYYTKEKNVAEELQNAQNAYAIGEYSYAVEIYKKYKDTNPVAALNLGYLTSNGLGVKQSYEQASQYYLNAYNMKLNNGLDNYLFLKFCKPQNVEDTLSALLYGIDEENEKATIYAAYLQTNKLYSNARLIKDQAQTFKSLNHEKQIDLLTNQIIKINEYSESFVEGYTPKNTEFKEYVNTNKTYTHKFVADTLTELKKINGKWIEIKTPVYDYELRYLFLIKCKGFNYAEQCFTETFLTIT